ncbi:MAG: SRPBCC domain-containing protein [Geminicoccaceae bacterium]
MATTVDRVDETQKLELTLTRDVKAPRNRVWRAWTDPDQLSEWFFPGDCSLVDPQFDVREGGSYRCCFRHHKGTDFWLRGIFEELVEPERLVFTHGWENEAGEVERDTRITVHLTEQNGGTRISFRQSAFASEESRASHEEGWGQVLDHLTAHLT